MQNIASWRKQMKKKKRKNKIRNGLVAVMLKHCKGGPMKNKKDKRKNKKYFLKDEEL